MSDHSDERIEAATIEKLRQQYSDIAQFAGQLAHEIKNPLSVIRMNMDLLAEDLAKPENHRERRALSKVLVVQEQCERLQKLLSDFLKFARLQQLELSPGDLNDVVQRVLDLYSPKINEQQIEVVRYLSSDLPSILLDDETLYVALSNLVLNAIQAMPEGGTFTVRTRLTRGGIALDLIDTGCGMNEDTALHMFDAFFTTKEGGSGLGLPLARKIIEAHGGRIDVQSEAGRGTQFTLEFPLPPRLK